MSEQRLFDMKGNLQAIVETRSNGEKLVRDRRGNPTGFMNKSGTHLMSGQIVSRDQRMDLISPVGSLTARR